MKYKVGQLVMNPKLGLGKILSISGQTVTAYFKEQAENPRTINVSVVPMPLASEQTDPLLDTLDAQGRLRKVPKAAAKTNPNPPAAPAPAAATPARTPAAPARAATARVARRPAPAAAKSRPAPSPAAAAARRSATAVATKSRPASSAKRAKAR